MSKEIVTQLYKANGPGDVPDMYIGATDPIPDSGGSASAHAERMKAEAQSLYAALVRSLPQGVLDHLFAIMAQRKATLFTVVDVEEANRVEKGVW